MKYVLKMSIYFAEQTSDNFLDSSTLKILQVPVSSLLSQAGKNRQAGSIVITGNRVLNLVGIAVGIDEGHNGNPELAAFVIGEHAAQPSLIDVGHRTFLSRFSEPRPPKAVLW